MVSDAKFQYRIRKWLTLNQEKSEIILKYTK